MIKEITPIYLKENKNHLKALISAVEVSDTKNVRLYAHAIRGAGRNMGVEKLSEMAYQLETMALEEDLSKAEQLLQSITTEFHKLEEFVSKTNWIETAKRQATLKAKT